MQYTLQRVLAAVQGKPAITPLLMGLEAAGDRQKFPDLPGYRPPPYQEARYGIVTKYEEDDSGLPSGVLSSPTEALRGLTLAALKAEPMDDDYALLRFAFLILLKVPSSDVNLEGNHRDRNLHRKCLSQTWSRKAGWQRTKPGSSTACSSQVATSSCPSSTHYTTPTRASSFGAPGRLLQF